MSSLEHCIVRDATPADVDGLVAVGRAHGFTGRDTAVDPHYRDFVMAHGRLVVALVDGQVVGFGGAIDVDRARLVTDLFLLGAHQGRGHGGAMLATLLDGAEGRMTFSSGHERALPTYERFGMRPRWRLDYWSGSSPGEIGEVGDPVAVGVTVDGWCGDRPDLAQHWARNGAHLLHLGDAGGGSGHAIVLPPAAPDGAWEIVRVVSGSQPEALRSVLSTVPQGARVELCAPDRSEASEVLEPLGFTITDGDTYCASDGVDIDADVVALHPGLG